MSASRAARRPEVRPAVLGRDAQRLALARGDVGAELARRREHRERDRLHDRHEQRAGGVGERARPRPSARGCRTRWAGRAGRPRPVDRRRRAPARAQPGRSCRRRSVGSSSSDMPAALEVGPRRIEVVAMDRAADQDPRGRVARTVIRAASAVAARRRSARPRRPAARSARRCSDWYSKIVWSVPWLISGWYGV